MTVRGLLLAGAMAACGCSGRALPFGPPSGVGGLTGDAGVSGDLATTGAHDLAAPHDQLPPHDQAFPHDQSGPADLASSSDMGFSPAACLTGGSVIYLDGDPGSFVHPGQETLQADGNWTSQGSDAWTFDYVWQPGNGVLWELTFSTQQLNQLLGPGLYTDAQRHPFETPGHPGFDISGDGRGCNTESGWFQVYDATQTPGGDAWSSFTATFEQHCEGATAALRGCVHYELPPSP